MSERTWKIIEALNWASSFLGTETNAPELLLAHLLSVDRTHLLLKLREDCPQDVMEQFQSLIARHKKGMPVQYLIGEEHFYGRSFAVNEAVLIPRPETEELIAKVVEKIENRFRKEESITGCDIGTGSGCIAITLALELPNLSMTAIDISEQALLLARENAKRLGADHVEFVHGDLLSPVIEKKQRYHIVVTNPPYIETEVIETLDIGVRDYEPRLALDGGKDGLDFYRRIIEALPKVLKPKAIVGFEVGAGQSDEVMMLLRQQFPDAQIETTYDINQKDRVVTAEIGF
jgi:release factor glutamine methyltransferase